MNSEMSKINLMERLSIFYLIHDGILWDIWKAVPLWIAGQRIWFDKNKAHKQKPWTHSL